LLRGSRSGRFRAATVRATVRENQFMPVLAYNRSTCRESRSNRASGATRAGDLRPSRFSEEVNVWNRDSPVKVRPDPATASACAQVGRAVRKR
jgi:hypothetical protein